MATRSLTCIATRRVAGEVADKVVAVRFTPTEDAKLKELAATTRYKSPGLLMRAWAQAALGGVLQPVEADARPPGVAADASLAGRARWLVDLLEQSKCSPALARGAADLRTLLEGVEPIPPVAPVAERVPCPRRSCTAAAGVNCNTSNGKPHKERVLLAGRQLPLLPEVEATPRAAPAPRAAAKRSAPAEVVQVRQAPRARVLEAISYTEFRSVAEIAKLSGLPAVQVRKLVDQLFGMHLTGYKAPGGPEQWKRKLDRDHVKKVLDAAKEWSTAAEIDERTGLGLPLVLECTRALLWKPLEEDGGEPRRYRATKRAPPVTWAPAPVEAAPDQATYDDLAERLIAYVAVDKIGTSEGIIFRTFKDDPALLRRVLDDLTRTGGFEREGPEGRVWYKIAPAPAAPAAELAQVVTFLRARAEDAAQGLLKQAGATKSKRERTRQAFRRAAAEIEGWDLATLGSRVSAAAASFLYAFAGKLDGVTMGLMQRASAEVARGQHRR